MGTCLYAAPSHRSAIGEAVIDRGGPSQQARRMSVSTAPPSALAAARQAAEAALARTVNGSSGGHVGTADPSPARSTTFLRFSTSQPQSAASSPALSRRSSRSLRELHRPPLQLLPGDATPGPSVSAGSPPARATGGGARSAVLQTSAAGHSEAATPLSPYGAATQVSPTALSDSSLRTTSAQLSLRTQEAHAGTDGLTPEAAFSANGVSAASQGSTADPAAHAVHLEAELRAALERADRMERALEVSHLETESAVNQLRDLQMQLDRVNVGCLCPAVSAVCSYIVAPSLTVLAVYSCSLSLIGE